MSNFFVLVLKLSASFLFTAVAFAFPTISEPSGDEVKSILSEIEKVHSMSGFVNGRVVYSKGQLSNSNLRRENAHLKATYMQAIESLRGRRDVYNNLDAVTWIKVTRHLLDLDELVSSDLGWGNLVFKVFILDLIQSSIYYRAKEERGKVALDKYLSLLSEIRERLPSRLAIFDVAVDHAGFPSSLFGVGNGVAKSLSAGSDPTEQIRRLTEIAKRMEKNKELMSVVNQAMADFNKLRVKSYRQLFEEEMVWPFYMTNSSESVFFDLYMYICSRSHLTDEVGAISDPDFDFSGMFDSCSKEEFSYLRHWDAQGYAAARRLGKVGGSEYEIKFKESDGEMDLSRVWFSSKPIKKYWVQRLIADKY